MHGVRGPGERDRAVCARRCWHSGVPGSTGESRAGRARGPGPGGPGEKPKAGLREEPCRTRSRFSGPSPAVRDWSQAGPQVPGPPRHGIRPQPGRAWGRQSHPQTGHHPGTPEQKRSRSRSGQHGVGRTALAPAGTLPCRQHSAGKPTRCPSRAGSGCILAKRSSRCQQGGGQRYPPPVLPAAIARSGPGARGFHQPTRALVSGPGHGQLPVFPNEESVITARTVGRAGAAVGICALLSRPGGSWPEGP